MSRTGAATPRSPVFLPATLIGLGVALLIANFLLVGVFSLTSLSFLVLVAAGIVVLLRGDIVPTAQQRAFGITRGSVESASLHINSSDVDVTLQSLSTTDRLIAGQFANLSRPGLAVEGTHATLVFDRARTSLLNMADWDLSLAPALPWRISCGTSLGQVDADLSGLIVDTAEFYTGFGSVRVVAPQELLGEPIAVRSVLGNIHIVSPHGYHVRVLARPTRFFKIHADEERYTITEDNTFIARHPHADAPVVTIQVRGSFGDAYLS